MGIAFAIHRSNADGTRTMLALESETIDYTLGDSFLAETIAQHQAWVHLTNNIQRWNIPRGASVTLLTDNQATLLAMNSLNPNYTATAHLQKALAQIPFNIKLRWIPAHCDLPEHDDVDELAEQAMQRSRMKFCNIRKQWNKRKKTFTLNIALEANVAYRIIHQQIQAQYMLSQKYLDTFFGRLADTHVSSAAKVCHHVDGTVMSRINRMRTNRTMFQTKRRIQIYCKKCNKEQQVFCPKCAKNPRGKYAYTWNKCPCGSQNSIEHIISQCNGTRDIRRARAILFQTLSRYKRNQKEDARENRRSNKRPFEIALFYHRGNQEQCSRINELLYNLRTEYSRFWLSHQPP